MATKLTPRQTEVQALQRDGLKAPAIAEKLEISENAVYQHLRKIREAKGAKPAAAKSTTAKKSGRSSGAKPAAKPAAVASTPPAPTPVPVAAPKQLTPLQAVRAHRESVTGDLKAAEQAVKDASTALDRAEAARDKIKARVQPQLDQLDAAEAALQGKLALPVAEAPAETPVAPVEKPVEAAPAKPAQAKRDGGSKSSSKGSSAPKPAKPAQAPATPASEPAKVANAAATPEPANQAEREATADPFDTGDDTSAQDAAEAPAAA